MTTELIHGMFTPLKGKLAMVKAWPGINPEDVDLALEAATQKGTIAGYEAEARTNTLLDIVITPYLDSLPPTVLFARDRMKAVWGDRYGEWGEVFGEPTYDACVKASPNAPPFTPNRIVIEVVDFGANWNPQTGTDLGQVMRTQAAQLAGLAVIHNAAQSPKWVERMDGKNTPYAIAAALRLKGRLGGGWDYTPLIWHNGKACLAGSVIGECLYREAVPTLREYRR